MDVSTIHEWNAAFDMYMRIRFHQCFPMHLLMAQHIADLSTALNNYWIIAIPRGDFKESVVLLFNSKLFILPLFTNSIPLKIYLGDIFSSR